MNSMKTIAIAIAVSFIAQGCAAQGCAPPETTLDRAISQTRDAVRSGRTPDFLTLIGPEGLTIGSEGGALSQTDLATELNNRQGLYCDLFSCNGRKGRLNNLMTSGNASKVISKARNGDVFAVVTLHRGHATDETELHYAYVDCRWQLLAISTL